MKTLSLQIEEGKLFLDGMRLYGVEKYEIKMSSDLPMGKAELEVKLIVSYHENEIGKDLSQGLKALEQAGSCKGGGNLLLKIYKELVVIRKELQIIRKAMESEKNSDVNYRDDIEEFLRMIERMRVQVVRD